MELQKRYSEYQKTNDLPDLDLLDRLFDVSDLDECTNLLKGIRHNIAGHIEEFAKFIEDKITPDNNIRNVFECNAFDIKTKDELYKIYKELMYILRWSTELDLLLDEKMDARFISEITSRWQEIKPELHKLIIIVKESWKKENNIKEHIGYMG